MSLLPKLDLLENTIKQGKNNVYNSFQKLVIQDSYIIELCPIHPKRLQSPLQIHDS